MPKFKYNPLVDPHPTRMFKGWASRAQRRHFLARVKLHKYIGGNDFWTPRRGHAAVAGKLKSLPNRIHPIKRGRKK